MTRFLAKSLLIVLAAAALIGAVAVVLAPYVYAELWPWRNSYDVVNPAPAEVAKGEWFDDYFVVEQLGEGTYAIGEPRYYQANYAYLIVGRTRALLFDAGSGTRNMQPVVASLTALPVTVLPSHLHFDHLGGVGAFDHIAMLDIPATRADVIDGVFRPGRYDFLGMFDGRTPPSFAVSEWIKPGATLDLGDRLVTVLSVPGHTAQSVAVMDSQVHWLFAGDFIYPTMLYSFLPGASRSAYRETARSLLALLPQDTILWTGHCCRRDEGFAAPWLTMADLRDLEVSLAQIEDGSGTSEGFYPRVYPVNDQMVLGTSWPWNNR